MVHNRQRLHLRGVPKKSLWDSWSFEVLAGVSSHPDLFSWAEDNPVSSRVLYGHLSNWLPQGRRGTLPLPPLLGRGLGFSLSPSSPDCVQEPESEQRQTLLTLLAAEIRVWRLFTFNSPSVSLPSISWGGKDLDLPSFKPLLEKLWRD